MKERWSSLLILLSLWTLAIGGARAESHKVEVRQGGSNAFVKNYEGFSGTMLIDNEWQAERYEHEIAFQLIGAKSPARRRIIMRFDLTFLEKKVADVAGASLILYKYLGPQSADQSFTFSVYEISLENKDWTMATWLFPESSSRWAGGPGLEVPGFDFEEMPLAAGVEFDATLRQGEEAAKISLPASLVERWIQGKNAGLLLVIDEESTTDKNGYFYSSNAGNPEEVRPLLEVNYTKNK